ncbi:MAG: DUF4345 domain-containing protein [Xanthobacteraceae bacterium]|nr:DUF4345 domain-containing protein [Xanthobacteraceae bacterium]
MERTSLQIAVGFSALVLFASGITGVTLGVELLHGRNGGLVDSYFRFLAAMMAAMGVMFALTIPHIERHSERMSTLSFLIFVGGLAHLYTFTMRPTPTLGTLFMLFMELVFIPLLWIAQRHVAHKAVGVR